MLCLLIAAKQLALVVLGSLKPESLAGKQDDEKDRTDDQRHMGNPPLVREDMPLPYLLCIGVHYIIGQTSDDMGCLYKIDTNK